MSSIRVSIDGDVEELIAKLQNVAGIDKAGVMNAIAEGLRTSTYERFDKGLSPEGKKWEPSIRVKENGGTTLLKTTDLRTSIKAKSDSTGAAVGTNKVYAATHQFGAERTIRARKSKYLRFQIGGRWVCVPSVRINIPARPFLGISDEDKEEIKELLDEAFKELT